MITGCLQYYFGGNIINSGTDLSGGPIQSFNFDGGFHLANQNQLVCVRREAGFCFICFAQVDNVNFMDFGISAGNY